MSKLPNYNSFTNPFFKYTSQYDVLLEGDDKKKVENVPCRQLIQFIPVNLETKAHWKNL